MPVPSSSSWVFPLENQASWLMYPMAARCGGEVQEGETEHRVRGPGGEGEAGIRRFARSAISS